MTLPDALHSELRERGLVAPGAEPVRQLGGLSNQVWRVGEVCVKLYGAQTSPPLFPNAPVSEWDALQRHHAEVLAPNPLALFTCNGQAVIVYDWVHSTGAPVGACDLGRALAQVHRGAPSGRVGRDPCAEGALILEQCADQGLWQFAPERIEVSTPAVHLHGDAVPGNLVNTVQGVCLIDWQAANVGTAWHDIAIAVSPAMRLVEGLAPWSAAERDALIDAAGLCPETWQTFAPAYHWRMACHCQWRIERGFTPYQAGLVAEIRAALRSTHPAG